MVTIKTEFTIISEFNSGMVEGKFPNIDNKWGLVEEQKKEYEEFINNNQIHKGFIDVKDLEVLRKSLFGDE